MSCQQCEGERIANFGAKCSDMFDVQMGDKEHNGYVPGDFGIGGGDYIRVEFCLDCGQMQGDFPLPETALETGEEDDEDE